ncbi:TPA: quinolinate synthase [bacterium]|nr:quinolinate synthase [bacterium]
MELTEEIKRLCQKKKAIILVHNYQPGEIQDIADFVGDSLELSRKAAETKAEIIIFCGVRFMAETAKILSPDRTVLLPDPEANCPLADMITSEGLKSLKAEHPDALVVSYVNTSAEVKAESDYCCTSANGIKVIDSLPTDRKIIFTPDSNLGRYLIEKTGKDLILWDGYCYVHHQRITLEGVRRAKSLHPEAKILVHPECLMEVIESADAVLSTKGMCEYVKREVADEFIIGTELGIIHRLSKENPTKRFYPVSEEAICESMKLTTLEKLERSLREEIHKIELDPQIVAQARSAIERMLAI